MKIALACDPAGVVLMPAVKKVLEEKGVSYMEFGISDNDTTRDYPVFAWRAAIFSTQPMIGLLQSPKSCTPSRI